MSYCHKTPGIAVVKELYGNASCCAFPGCSEPLYKIDGETGSRRLNSRVAHICARCEGGPRWNPEQSEQENRSVHNLLLLCIEHAVEIDDPEQKIKYRPELLREWKKSQLEIYDKTQNGWKLDDKEASEVLYSSFVLVGDVPIDISNSTIMLGGEGGKAIGAGGGGGGVIGANAIGGKGGDGGRIILNGQPGRAPGAGGGGGGVNLPSQRKVVDVDLENGLQISSLFLANHVQIVNNLVYVLGAGWEHLYVPNLPYEIDLPLVCMVSLGNIEPNILLELSAIVNDPNRILVVQKEFTVHTGEARSVARPSIVIKVTFTATKKGIYTITIASGEIELAQLPVEIKVKAN